MKVVYRDNIYSIYFFLLLCFNGYTVLYFYPQIKLIYLIVILFFFIVALTRIRLRKSDFVVLLCFFYFTFFFDIRAWLNNLYLIFIPLFTLVVAISDFKKDTILSIIYKINILLFISCVVYIIEHMYSLPSLMANHPYSDRTYTCYLLVSCTEFNYPDRFAFIFEEPGTMGSIALIALLFSYLTGVKDLKYNFGYIISGFLSLSLFFYVGLYIYSIMYFFIRKRYILFLFVVFGPILVIAVYYRDIISLDLSFFHRFEFNSNGIIIGVINDRVSTGLSDFYENMSFSQYLFGFQDKLQNIYPYLDNSFNYKNAVIEKGFFGIYVLFLGLYIWLKDRIHNNKNLFIIFMILILFFYQRPLIYEPYYMMIIFIYARYNELRETIDV